MSDREQRKHPAAASRPGASKRPVKVRLERRSPRGGPAGAPEAIADALLFFEEGMARFHAGDVPGAIGACEAATRSDPGFLDAWYNLGRLHDIAGNGEAAARAFRKAIAIRPDRPEIWFHLGNG